MSNDVTTLVRAGGEGQILEDFQAILDATAPDGGPRHAPYPTMDWLARFITGQSGGPHKDAPLYELFHLINAIGLVDPSRDSRALFFLAPDRVTPAYARNWFQTTAQGSKLTIDNEQITLNYLNGPTFGIRFGRMPNLAALYEFLCGMDGYGFYQRFEDICTAIQDKPDSVDSIKSATNALSAEMRQYRRRYLDTARSDGKFTDIFAFLQSRNADKNQINVDDTAILDFWLLHNHTDDTNNPIKDYRGYRTVFDLFITFTDSLREAGGRMAIQGAAPLGTDRDAGEMDISADDVLTLQGDSWSSPLDAFDVPPLKDINFFKKSSERKPMEALMRYGPDALRLPLAFLRYEVFGQIQSGITNDLQVGRGAASVAQRITCAEAEPYDRRRDTVSGLAQHCQDMSKATLHAIAPQQADTVVAFPGKASPEQVFRKTNRKGFEDFAPEEDPSRRNAFREAADKLVTIGQILNRYLDQLNRMDSPDTSLAQTFETDRAIFSDAFGRIYGDRT